MVKFYQCLMEPVLNRTLHALKAYPFSSRFAISFNFTFCIDGLCQLYRDNKEFYDPYRSFRVAFGTGCVSVMFFNLFKLGWVGLAHIYEQIITQIA